MAHSPNTNMNLFVKQFWKKNANVRATNAMNYVKMRKIKPGWVYYAFPSKFHPNPAVRSKHFAPKHMIPILPSTLRRLYEARNIGPVLHNDNYLPNGVTALVKRFGALPMFKHPYTNGLVTAAHLRLYRQPKKKPKRRG
jgi:hypothetical protein